MTFGVRRGEKITQGAHDFQRLTKSAKRGGHPNVCPDGHKGRMRAGTVAPTTGRKAANAQGHRELAPSPLTEAKISQAWNLVPEAYPAALLGDRFGGAREGHRRTTHRRRPCRDFGPSPTRPAPFGKKRGDQTGPVARPEEGGEARTEAEGKLVPLVEGAKEESWAAFRRTAPAVVIEAVP